MELFEPLRLATSGGGRKINLIQMLTRCYGFLSLGWPCTEFLWIRMLFRRSPLHQLLVSSNDFARVFWSADNPSILFWSDDCQIGNQLRPDSVGKTTCLQWAVSSLPEYIRNSDFGWWPIGVLPASIVSTLAGGLSGLWRHVLMMFFVGQPNFKFGVALPTNARSTTKRVWRAGIKFFVQDELAIRSTLQNKGSSGSVPCPMCHNVYGGAADADIPGAANVHHFAHCLPAQFEAASDDTVWKTIDYLALQTRAPRARQAELAQNLGVQEKRHHHSSHILLVIAKFFFWGRVAVPGVGKRI